MFQSLNIWIYEYIRIYKYHKNVGINEYTWIYEYTNIFEYSNSPKNIRIIREYESKSLVIIYTYKNYLYFRPGNYWWRKYLMIIFVLLSSTKTLTLFSHLCRVLKRNLNFLFRTHSSFKANKYVKGIYYTRYIRYLLATASITELPEPFQA